MKLEQHIASDVLLQRLGIFSLTDAMRMARLRWFGHVQRSSGWIQKVTKHVVEGGASRRGQPQKTWKEAVSNDIKD